MSISTTYISTRKGIVDTRGTLLGSPDKGSQTRKRPQGRFQDFPVMGWGMAQKMGLVKVLFTPCRCKQTQVVFAHSGEEHKSVSTLLDEISAEASAQVSAKVAELRAALGY